MPGRGPVAQKEHTRKSNDKKQISLISDGKLRGPALPRGIMKDRAGKALPWHPATVKWWNSWRKSPQAIRMMTGPDWDYLLDTARIHHEFWTSGRWELAAELRLRAAKFGATPEDRARLGVEIGTGSPGESAEKPAASPGDATVSSIDERRARMTAEG